jgi:hypothetical protein
VIGGMYCERTARDMTHLGAHKTCISTAIGYSSTTKQWSNTTSEPIVSQRAEEPIGSDYVVAIKGIL